MSNNNKTKFVLDDCINWHKTAEIEKELGHKLPWSQLPRHKIIRSAHLRIVPGTNIREVIDDINRNQNRS